MLLNGLAAPCIPLTLATSADAYPGPIVMEYLSGGPIEWTNAEHKPILLVDQTRRIIRDVIVGLDYRMSICPSCAEMIAKACLSTRSRYHSSGHQAS